MTEPIIWKSKSRYQGSRPATALYQEGKPEERRARSGSRRLGIEQLNSALKERYARPTFPLPSRSAPLSIRSMRKCFTVNILHAKIKKTRSISRTREKICLYRASSCANGVRFPDGRSPRMMSSCCAGCRSDAEINFMTTEAYMNCPEDLFTTSSTTAGAGHARGRRCRKWWVAFICEKESSRNSRISASGT